ncbi:sugar transferase [Flavobacterium sp.]|uniref:sugar transferase n=1 Tax=Flavobacterium sp. TaxID=239 RepID=UPI00260DEAE0|nr:sugar transferase [Flavobacterium sp.]
MIRIFDVLISFTAIIILLPVFLIIAIVILVKDGRPVFYAQSRSGRYFENFSIYKFRTMVQNTDDRTGLTQGTDDPRITTVGSVLRKTKLDELPQLLNVLIGSMSVVGSRPQVPFYTNKFRDYYEKILEKKPGILSPAAIKFSDEDEILAQVDDPVKYYEEVLVPIKCEMDIALVEKFGIGSYFSVILAYIKKVFSKDN